jgi:hypothetical protein
MAADDIDATRIAVSVRKMSALGATRGLLWMNRWVSVTIIADLLGEE